ncbi:MAG: substrate-binding domain-containing protein [Candidatus Eremiobacteraeota bacterium]|nr:substrate-binding domain-containing protein [Candidatus Eremiobacteraeota bacterium]
MKRLTVVVLFLLGIVSASAAPAPVVFRVPCIDAMTDFHGEPAGADLVVFVSGNEWFAVPRILAAFQRAHPEVRKVFYETLPPGVLAQQMHTGGAIKVGEFTLRVQPDVYISGKRRMRLEESEGVVEPSVTFASNVLGIIVKDGNPKHIRSLSDLQRADVRVAMPNPGTEGIARQIELAYKKTGGDTLNHTIMVTKLHNGTTMLTSIHHRESPMWILEGKADAGPVWISEALYQERIHSGIMAIRIPDRDNASGLYLAAVVKRAAHERAAHAFTSFLTSPEAQAIYRSYGFSPAISTEE